MTENEAVLVNPQVLDVLEVTFSPTIGNLVAALAKAQLAFKPVLKTVDNAAFMRQGKASKYADLAEYIDATQEALAKNELVVMQWPDVSPEAKSMSLVSILAHSSGEWVRGRLTLPAIGRDGFTAQSCGSSITYARRYSYAAITGCASEDDDGNAASGRGTHEAAQEVAAEKTRELKKKLGRDKDPDQLTVVQVGEDAYEIAGDPDVMNRYKEPLLAYGKRAVDKGKPRDAVVMSGEGLDFFRRDFVENRGGILTPLKATWTK